jgi:four helix bundle protein
VVLEEADETVYWLELIAEADQMPRQRMEGIIKEANELVRIFAAARQTLKGK